jgi:hypothetical protein
MQNKAIFINTEEHGLVMPIKEFNKYIELLKNSMAEVFMVNERFLNESKRQEGLKKAMDERRTFWK